MANGRVDVISVASPEGLQVRPPSHTSNHCKSLAGYKKKSLSATYSYPDFSTVKFVLNAG